MLFITHEADISTIARLQSLYFYANRDPLHVKWLLMISKLESQHKMPFSAIDTDYFANQCKRFSVTSVPTLIVFSFGMEIARIKGFVSTRTFMSVFDDIYERKGEGRS